MLDRINGKAEAKVLAKENLCRYCKKILAPPDNSYQTASVQCRYGLDLGACCDLDERENANVVDIILHLT